MAGGCESARLIWFCTKMQPVCAAEKILFSTIYGALEEVAMDFAAFELDRPFVIEAMRRGDIDYLENLSEAAEADFFRHPIGRDALTRLAETSPTPRKKEEVQNS